MNSTLINKKIDRIGKESLLKLVMEHKKTCNIPDCDISLLPILIWLESKGIKFTDEEKGWFA